MNAFHQILMGIKSRVEACRDSFQVSARAGRLSKIGPFSCPVCGARTWKFDPLPEFLYDMWRKYGRDMQLVRAETCNVDAYQCSGCRASDRARLYALYLADWFDLLPRSASGIFLDFAPTDSLKKFIQAKIGANNPLLRYLTADLMMPDVDLRVDIANMPEIQNDSAVFFVCSHVLEHVPDDRRAMRELFRILKPGGKGILMVPIRLGQKEIDEDPSVTDVGERWRRFGQDDHVRAYNRQGFLERVREAGFHVEELGNKHFGRWTFWRHGITQRSVLYVVSRPRNTA
ncbi:MAG: methyltransferase domain-containing protein [Kiritimatiellia bacterium]|jgi:SAM-dependent methyltransferase